MLEGTDLSSAYGLLTMHDTGDIHQQDSSAVRDVRDTVDVKAINSSTKKYVSEPQQNIQQTPQVVQPQPPIQQSLQQSNVPTYNANQFNQYFNNEQKMVSMMNELRQRQAAAVAASSSSQSSTNYFDKLASKKKDLMKFLHSAFIIIFALSVHFLLSHYFSWYLENRDVSFERELILRLLYPIGILFIAWNIMLVIKG